MVVTQMIRFGYCDKKENKNIKFKMIHIRTFYGYSEEDCIRNINNEVSDDKIINIIPLKSRHVINGWDEYDEYDEYSMKVIYKD